MINHNQLPLVTIVIPSYNHEKYILASIESALLQRYPNFEILIIDDGSVDGSVDLIEKYIKSLPSEKKNIIRFISRENRGLSATLNQALSIIEAQYLVMLASDDVLTKYSLKKTIFSLINDEKIAAVSGSVATIDSDNKKLPLVFVRKQKKKYITFQERFIESEAFFAPGSVFRKSAIISVGGFNEKVWVEDFYIQLKLLDAGFKLLRIKDVVAYYRRHANNSSNALESMSKEADKVRAMFSERSDYQDLTRARHDYIKASEIRTASINKFMVFSKLKNIIKSLLIKLS